LKKAARLKFVSELFGPQYVMEFQICRTWRELLSAIRYFEASGREWGIRTDGAGGYTQGVTFPFIQLGSLSAAEVLWQQYGTSLEYIVYDSFSEPCLNAVAERIDRDYVHFEYNPIDLMLSQRQMDKFPDHLRHLMIGPLRRNQMLPEFFLPFSFCPITPSGPVYQPDDNFVRDNKFAEIYRRMQEAEDCHIKEARIVTFTLRLPDRRLIIW